MLDFTFNATVLIIGVFFLSITVMVAMIIAGVADDKQYRLKKLYQHPMIEEVLQQAPNEIVSLFRTAVYDTSNIDPYMLEYLEFYIHKAK